MNIDTQISGAQINVNFSGKLTFSESNAFRQLMSQISASGATVCIFDFGKLEAIDSSGLGMVMIAIDAAKKGGFSLSVKNANGPVAELLRLSRLDTLIKAA